MSRGRARGASIILMGSSVAAALPLGCASAARPRHEGPDVAPSAAALANEDPRETSRSEEARPVDASDPTFPEIVAALHAEAGLSVDADASARVLYVVRHGGRAVGALRRNVAASQADRVTIVRLELAANRWVGRGQTYDASASVLARTYGIDPQPVKRAIELIVHADLASFDGDMMRISLAESPPEPGLPGFSGQTETTHLYEQTRAPGWCNGARYFTGTTQQFKPVRLEACVARDGVAAVRVVLEDEAPKPLDPTAGAREGRIPLESARFSWSPEPRGTGWATVGRLEILGTHRLSHIARVASFSGTSQPVAASFEGAVVLVSVQGT